MVHSQDMPRLLICVVAAGGLALLGCGSAAQQQPKPAQPAQAVFCPKQSSGADRFNALDLIGSSEDAARAVAARHGCVVRVAERDGVHYALTADFRRDRVDLRVRHGLVFAVWVG
jgi:hypothetical protein